MTPEQYIIDKCTANDPSIMEWKDGAIVSLESYEMYFNEGGSETFTDTPNDFETGIILGDKVYGGGMIGDLGLEKKDFENRVYTEGVDENGGIDVWEYIKCKILGRDIYLHDVLGALSHSEANWKRENLGCVCFELEFKSDEIEFRIQDDSCKWNLKKPLHEQTEETKLLISKILGYV